MFLFKADWGGARSLDAGDFARARRGGWRRPAEDVSLVLSDGIRAVVRAGFGRGGCRARSTWGGRVESCRRVQQVLVSATEYRMPVRGLHGTDAPATERCWAAHGRTRACMYKTARWTHKARAEAADGQVTRPSSAACLLRTRDSRVDSDWASQAAAEKGIEEDAHSPAH